MNTGRDDKPKSRSPKDGLDAGGDRMNGCNCRKSKCLKLYCECFAASKMCTPSVCKCQECRNNPDYGDERLRAIEETQRKNARAFEPKIAKEASQADDAAHRRGCRCKKSNCLKRYCECFNGNVKCTQVCRCVNCKNDGSSVEKVDDDNSPQRKTKPQLEQAEKATPDVKESPTTPKKEVDLDRQMSAQLYMMSPHMTPLLEGAGWQDGLFHGGAGVTFACSPLPAEDMNNLLPQHMQTPLSKEDAPPGGNPTFSPPLQPVDDIDPNEPMSFLISPGKAGTPFKLSPMKATTAMHPPPVAPTYNRSIASPVTKSFHKLIGSNIFTSPQKAMFQPNGSTAPEAPPSGVMPTHTARRISPRKRPGVFTSDGKPPRAPTTPQPHSPPMKKARPNSERSPQVSPLWSRSPMNIKDVKGETAALDFLASPLGLRGDQTETPKIRRSGPNFSPMVSSINMSPMCDRVVADTPGGLNIIH